MSGIVVKDHSIKLFGKTIDLLPFIDQIQSFSVTSTSQETKDLSGGEITHEYDESTNPADETSSEISDGTATKNSEISQTESSSNTSPEKETLKKPDEILPCPRCESMDTKFCYFNNYNVNQPRYFCRKCQRYWTCGGTMRNVPVGSGRRKNKNVVVPNYRHVIVQESGAGQYSNPNGFFVFGPSNADPNSTRNGFPVAFYPTASYWGSAVTSPPWNIPLNPESSVLGKHPREENQKTMIRPKMLRIDDPNEAAKSSIWSTIGMKREKIGSFVFKAFDPKLRHNNNNRSVDSTETALQANPAALSRSVNFQELAR